MLAFTSSVTKTNHVHERQILKDAFASVWNLVGTRICKLKYKHSGDTLKLIFFASDWNLVGLEMKLVILLIQHLVGEVGMNMEKNDETDGDGLMS